MAKNFQNPRINLTLEPELLNTLKEYSKLEGRPVATIIKDLLLETLPMMEATVKLSKELETVKTEEREKAMLEFQRQAFENLGKVFNEFSQLSIESKK